MAESRDKPEQRTQFTAQLEATQEDEQATDEWLAVIRDYAHLEELDRPTLLRLLKRIEVGVKYEIAGETHLDIDTAGLWSGILCGAECVIMLLPIIPTEKALKRRFG